MIDRIKERSRAVPRMKEQRTNARHNEQGRVAVRILSASHGPALEGQTFFCVTRDVSAGGLSFEVRICRSPAVPGWNLVLSS